jgi:tetratricopeptide (TPR) repeat protein
MKKIFLYSLIILFAFGLGFNSASAKVNLEGALKIAIKKYKSGNYTGALQDCLGIVMKDPSNAAAYYYLAISYVQVGKQDEAIKCYSKVLTLNQNDILNQLSLQGKTCLETPEKCTSSEGDTSDLDKFLAKPSSVFSPKVLQTLEQKNLDTIKNDINNDKEIDSYKIRQLNNFSNKKSMMENNPLSSYTANKNNEIEQLNILMGEGDNQKNTNLMLKMLPFIMAQNNNDTSESYAPQLMQAVIMNSMMPDFTFNLDNTNK